MDSPIGPIRSRLRVTTGCKTCRARRVKCDETKPVCRNCAKKSRNCKYDGDATAITASPVSDGSARRRSHPINRHRQESVSDAADPFHSRNPGVLSSQLPARECNTVSDDRREDIGYQNSPPEGQTPADLASIFLQSRPVSPPQGVVTEPRTNTTAFEARDTAELEVQPRYVQDITSPTCALFVSERIPLTALEVSFFRNYVEVVSHWIDSFSRDRPFYSTVPIMALKCPVLMQSCLALSSKQLALKAADDEGLIRENIAIGYYRRAVKMISLLLGNSEYAGSDEILACSIILSTYEMFDVVGDSFGSHLKGIAFFLQSRQVTGDDPGIRGAAYWTWYRHEIWASLQIGRQMFLNELYWAPRPMDSFNNLSVEEIANRAIFLFGQCVSFCNNDGLIQPEGGDERHHNPDQQAVALDAALEDWKQKLPPSMSHFFSGRPLVPNASFEFPFIWFIYPQSAIAYQVYHASKILLTLHSPSALCVSPGPARIQSLSNRRQIERSREQIFFISNAGVPDTWSLVSTQCLFVAGMVTEGVLERENTLRLIEQCQKSSGRRAVSLVDELRRIWAQ